MPKHIGDNNFNEEVLNSKELVLVDFFATWCGPCKMVAPILEDLESEMIDIKFVKVDVDESPSVANQYGIQSIPTLKVFKDGKVVDTVVGFLPKEQIKSLIERNK
ncbi:thioredoxin [Clostridium sp.]|uniref:thioredoxin n=1 Tax=Clostridium sp. TaxID=1506 RepID=UPI0026DB88FD|nr:thioredoxin [Clostridium sp.]MDO5038914.1 thioredoxin [Clostridium sp.]